VDCFAPLGLTQIYLVRISWPVANATPQPPPPPLIDFQPSQTKATCQPPSAPQGREPNLRAPQDGNK
jgi:hypothetical protein